MNKTAKKISVSVTNDLVSDNRVHKVCNSLRNMGYEVELIGRIHKKSLPLQTRPYHTKRFNLIFQKGAAFYAEYNFRLFWYLLFNKNNILLSNDLDSLPANFVAAKFKGKPLVYDSHEYFTEVPELINRPKVKKIWEWIEKQILPHITYAYTVCDSIAKIYDEKYGVDFKVIRNFPLRKKQENPKTTSGQRSGQIILYQGALNKGRGLTEAIRAMHFVKNAKFLIAGDGDIKRELEQLVEKEKLNEKVFFTGRLSLDELSELTPTADLGISIEEDLGLNYRFALPNKLFDYIQAEIPVLISNLPEMKAIVEKYKVGEITNTLEPEKLAIKINHALSDKEKRKTWKKNLMLAAKELTWEKEEKVLKELFKQIK